MHLEALLIPLAGISLPLILVPTIMVLKSRARNREFQHRERMRAIETGNSLPALSHWPAALVCTAIGAGVPAMAFLFTLFTRTTSDFSEELWSPQSVVAIVGVTSGSWLAFKLMGRPDGDVSRSSVAPSHQKTYVTDPDAFDVVGRRG